MYDCSFSDNSQGNLMSSFFVTQHRKYFKSVPNHMGGGAYAIMESNVIMEADILSMLPIMLVLI